MDASIRSRSAVLTVIVHALILLVLIFSLMKIKIPPFPEAGGGGGVLVNIGMLEEAAGDVQPMSEEITKAPVTEKIIQQQVPEKEVATQDFEESPIAKEVKEHKKIIKEVKTETKPVKIEPKVEPVKTVNTKALYPGKTTTSKSQGTGKGVGDQGDPKGDPNSKYTGKNGSGGTGPGTGSGGGEGPGNGPGKGGFSYSLDGRKMIGSPKISDQSQETGRVVVSITVGKDGSVEAAVPGVRGSTTTSSYLLKLAKDAALKAKFNSSDNDEIQKGTITFDFVLQ